MAFLTVMFLAGVIHYGNAQCNGSAQIFEPGFTNSSITIMTPNYPREFGKSANCTWIFNNTGGSYYIDLRIRERRLHYEDGFNQRYCPTSYKAFISGAPFNCLPPIQSANETFCMTFYDPFTCVSPAPNSSCTPTKLLNDTLDLSYQANGTIDKDQSITGFVMDITFNECPQRIRNDTTPKPPENPSGQPTTRRPSTTHQTDGSFDLKAAVIALICVVGILAVIVLAHLIYLIATRRRKTDEAKQINEDAPDGVYEEAIIRPAAQSPEPADDQEPGERPHQDRSQDEAGRASVINNYTNDGVVNNRPDDVEITPL